MRRLDPVKHEEKRQEILAAAKACFAREGFRGASIADICAEAGISPGHLYHYFPGKEAILDAIGAASLKEGARQFGELVESGNALAAIGTVIEEAKRHNLRADFILFLELAAETHRNPKLAKTLREMSRSTRVILADFLKKGQAGGLDRSRARSRNRRHHPVRDSRRRADDDGARSQAGHGADP